MDNATTPLTVVSLPSDFKNRETDVQIHQVVDKLDQKPLNAKDATANPSTPEPTPTAVITIPSDYQIHEVDEKLDPRSKPKTPNPPQSPPLGVLANFTGDFFGSGFNIIFRPNSGPTPPAADSDNVLELNLTTETLSFSNPLGSVPNRGLNQQTDIFLNGVPYVQAIKDVTDVNTGKAGCTATDIHFEPGLWMHVPSTMTDPTLPESLVRMASIPHGTTINAQGLAPTTSIAGPPIIPAVSITPLNINTGAPVKPFPSQTASNANTPRLPQDLTKFIEEGTITQDILTDPNTVLRNANAGKTITKTIFFTVSTNPSSPELGGGTANIAFLQGAPATPTGSQTGPTGSQTGPTGSQTGPNANAVQMTATFWIETVQYHIVIPHFKPGQPPLKIAPSPPHPGAQVPVFEVNPPHEITAPKTITVNCTQIQYSQTVFLNFAGLTWPHVSVATLIPCTAQKVPPSIWN